MILTEHSVWMRAGQSGESFSYLMMCVERQLVNHMKYSERIDPVFTHYLFAYIFEDSTTCGESGVHQFIGAIDFAKEMVVAGFPNPMTPVKAWLLISLDEYDALRIRRKEWDNRFKNKHPFPEYAKVES